MQFISKGAFKGARLSPLVVHVDFQFSCTLGALMAVNTLLAVKIWDFPGDSHTLTCVDKQLQQRHPYYMQSNRFSNEWLHKFTWSSLDK